MLVGSQVEMEPLMRASSTSSTSSFDALDSPSSYTGSGLGHTRSLPRLLQCPLQSMLTESLLSNLLLHLPPNVAIRPSWTLLYSTSVHGHSLSTLYHRLSLNSDADGPNLLLCRDSDGWVFGCFTPVSWVQREVYYGSAECFVFRAWPNFQVWEAVEERKRREERERRERREEQRRQKREQQQQSYTARRSPEPVESMSEDDGGAGADEGEGRYYMLAKSDQLAIGSGRRFALWLDAAFRDGASGPCATFDSPTLSKRANFKAYEVECWGF